MRELIYFLVMSILAFGLSCAFGPESWLWMALASFALHATLLKMVGEAPPAQPPAVPQGLAGNAASERALLASLSRDFPVYHTSESPLPLAKVSIAKDVSISYQPRFSEKNALLHPYCKVNMDGKDKVMPCYMAEGAPYVFASPEEKLAAIVEGTLVNANVAFDAVRAVHPEHAKRAHDMVQDQGELFLSGKRRRIYYEKSNP